MAQIEFSEFIKWLFFGTMGAVGTYGVYVLANMNSSIEKLGESTSELNVKMATVVARIEAHEKRLDNLEDDLR